MQVRRSIRAHRATAAIPPRESYGRVAFCYFWGGPVNRLWRGRCSLMDYSLSAFMFEGIEKAGNQVAISLLSLA